MWGVRGWVNSPSLITKTYVIIKVYFLEDGKFSYVCDVSFGRLTDIQGTYNVADRSPNHCYIGNAAVRSVCRLCLSCVSLSAIQNTEFCIKMHFCRIHIALIKKPTEVHFSLPNHVLINLNTHHRHFNVCSFKCELWKCFN